MRVTAVKEGGARRWRSFTPSLAAHNKARSAWVHLQLIPCISVWTQTCWLNINAVCSQACHTVSFMSLTGKQLAATIPGT